MNLTDNIKNRLNFRKILSQFLDIPDNGKIKAFCHDDHNESMMVYDDGAYCFTCARQFDIFSVWQHFKKVDFMTALDELALQAGIPIPQAKRKAMQAQRSRETKLEIVTSFYERRLWSPEGAQCLDYARGRGWSDDTIKRARLGWAAADTKLSKHLKSIKLNISEVMAKNGLDFCSRREGYDKSPGGFLIYPHILGMRVQYMAARSITPNTKEHRNLPGKKFPYWNWLYSHNSKECFLVEGQADAISLAVWGKPAIAVCGSRIEDIVK